MTADQQGTTGDDDNRDPILEVLARLDRLRAEDLPADRIATEMARFHPSAPGGGPWTAATVERVLAIVDSVAPDRPPPTPTAGPAAADAPLERRPAPRRPVSPRPLPSAPGSARPRPSSRTRVTADPTPRPARPDRSAPPDPQRAWSPPDDDEDDPTPIGWGRMAAVAVLLAGLGAGGYLGVMAVVGDDSSGTRLVGEVLSPTTVGGGTTSSSEAPDPADMMSVRVEPPDDGADDGADDGDVAAATATIRNDGKLYLEGAFASQTQADAFLDRAGEVFGRDNIVESYSVDPAAPAPTVGDIALDKPVLFETGTAVIHPDYIPFLEACAGVLKLNPQIVMSVSAYTDATGSEELNLDLSQRRAQAILDFYREQEIAEEQLEGRGYGEADPIADNDTLEGREQNRRAMLQLLNVMGEEAAALVVEDGEAPAADQ